MSKLKSLTLKGYKSIEALEAFELGGGLNVLIGANGAGKSNFISLFRLLSELAAGRLEAFVQEERGADALLFKSRKHTKQIDAEFYFGRNGYRISLKPVGQSLFFAREETWFAGDFATTSHSLGSGYRETKLAESIATDAFSRWVKPAVSGWRVFHFHDTSATAGMRNAQPVRDNLALHPNAENLAPFLRRLREQHLSEFKAILEAVRIVAPFFGDLVYRKNAAAVELEWFHAGDRDTPLGPLQLSDGTLRFLCLATLLLQPADYQPDTILLDEPELGLHPAALSVLAGMLHRAAEKKQIIVSTQSTELVDELPPDEIIVVEREGGATTFKRLEAAPLKDWLKDYRMGDLWKMNVLGGGPRRD